MAHRGFDVSAIDLPTSNFVGQRIWNVQDYDGHTIPFPENTFDVVFSSNTLEHIPHVRAFQDEIRRVLKPDGVAIHVLPSVSWRFWTNLTHPLRYWTPPLAHGEHASNALSELFAFRRSTWLRLFSETGWHQHTHVKSWLFYTGCCVADRYLAIPTRERLSKYLGSACNIFVLMKELPTIGAKR